VTFDLSPAPGRHPVPLGRGWTAVLLAPIPGRPILAVGVFLKGELKLLVDEAEEVCRLAAAIAREAHKRLEPTASGE